MKTADARPVPISALQTWVTENFAVRSGAVKASLRTAAYVLLGSLVLMPLMIRLPILGWDWYGFFTAHNPAFNLYSSTSAYPPFAHYFIETLTWIPNWRTSLALLNGITLLTVALATWQNGGRYREIVFALTTPPVWFLMWAGHPDGLVLLGLITGFVPLALIKPILSVYAMLENRKLLAWSALVLALSLLIWPGWVFSSTQGGDYGNASSVGWMYAGWYWILPGLVMLAGAGKDRYRLMAAGCFLTPYLMHYHMALLAPALGKPRGWRQVLVWFSAWGVFLGSGLTGPARLIMLLFPVAAYLGSITWEEYQENVKQHWEMIKGRARMAKKLSVADPIKKIG